MSFLAMAAVLGVLAVGGAWIGDPTYRPEHDPGRWRVTITVGIEE